MERTGLHYGKSEGKRENFHAFRFLLFLGEPFSSQMTSISFQSESLAAVATDASLSATAWVSCSSMSTRWKSFRTTMALRRDFRYALCTGAFESRWWTRMKRSRPTLTISGLTGWQKTSRTPPVKPRYACTVLICRRSKRSTRPLPLATNTWLQQDDDHNITQDAH